MSLERKGDSNESDDREKESSRGEYLTDDEGGELFIKLPNRHWEKYSTAADFSDIEIAFDRAKEDAEDDERDTLYIRFPDEEHGAVGDFGDIETAFHRAKERAEDDERDALYIRLLNEKHGAVADFNDIELHHGAKEHADQIVEIKPAFEVCAGLLAETFGSGELDKIHEAAKEVMSELRETGESLELSPERADRIASYLRGIFIDRTDTRDSYKASVHDYDPEEYVAQPIPSLDNNIAGGPSLHKDVSRESDRDNGGERSGPTDRS
jgi:hypothetical protein